MKNIRIYFLHVNFNATLYNDYIAKSLDMVFFLDHNNYSNGSNVTVDADSSGQSRDPTGHGSRSGGSPYTN